ncbi:MAG: glutathione S-transferase family protein [Xanthobacteraceae bacterium]
MTQLILHNYDFSNYAEKVRVALGYKDLDWASVIIPPVLPKPDLVPLTGGYRRTPVLQIGADVYCDTRLILKVLDRVAPQRPVFPEGVRGFATAVAAWAETALVHPLILYVSGTNQDVMPKELRTDRAKMRGLPEPSGETIARAARRNAPLVRTQIPLIENMLADKRQWICGDQFSIADLALYHPLWFITDRSDRLKHELAPYGAIQAWMQRVRSFGHGRPTTMSAAEALDIARGARPRTPGLSKRQPEDPPLGSVVAVRPDDYAKDSVSGELVFIDDDEIAILTRHERVGDVVVHFPRIGFDLRAASR